MTSSKMMSSSLHVSVLECRTVVTAMTEENCQRGSNLSKVWARIPLKTPLTPQCRNVFPRNLICRKIWKKQNKTCLHWHEFGGLNPTSCRNAEGQLSNSSPSALDTKQSCGSAWRPDGMNKDFKWTFAAQRSRCGGVPLSKAPVWWWAAAAGLIFSVSLFEDGGP